jgi:hypothetical protein
MFAVLLSRSTRFTKLDPAQTCRLQYANTIRVMNAEAGLMFIHAVY